MGFTWDELDTLGERTGWRIPLPPTCRKCAYNLTGLRDNRCPECGTPFNWREVQKRAAWTWALTMRMRHANQDSTLGVVLGLAGWLVLGLVRLVGIAPIVFVVDALLLLVALLTTILGSQVLNIRRVPKWARSYIGDPPPNLPLGAAAMFLGLSLMAGVILF